MRGGRQATATLVLAIILLLGGQGRAAQAETMLVMFETALCEWCARWHEEIGRAYPLTSEGARAPLRQVDLDATRPDDLRAVRGVVYTPTFVLMDRGAEIGRITGYPGEHFFWPMLSELLAKLPSAAEGTAVESTPITN